MQPFVSSLGLSMIVHLTVIGWYFAFGKKRGWNLYRDHRTNRNGSIAIAASISLFSVAVSIGVIYHSVQDQHATWRFAVNYAGSALEYILPSHPETVSASSEDPCLGSVSEVSQHYGYSLVDYMRAEGLDTSFEERARLAVQLGIADYNGTPLQNHAVMEGLYKMLNGGKSAVELDHCKSQDIMVRYSPSPK